MLKFGICWCKTGVMAQCTAPNYDDQQRCDYFDKSLGEYRCMHRNERMFRHCWSQKAQAFSRENGVVTPDDVELPDEEELNIDDFVELKAPQRSCHDCILFTCSRIIHENQMAQSRGGLTNQDLINIANTCVDYCDEAMINQTVSRIQRGIKP